MTGVADDHDWEQAIGEALRRSVDGFDTPPVPQFASNVGLAGMEKWARLLTDDRDSKGWPRLFDSGPRAALGLSRLYDCITNAYTAPAAGRPLFSDYLAEASQLIDHPGIGAAGEAFAASGENWSQVTELIVVGGEDLAAYAEAAELRTAEIDDEPGPDRMRALANEQRRLVAQATISSQDSAKQFAAIAAVVGEIIELERDGLSELRTP